MKKIEEIKNVVRSVYWLLKYTSENYDSLPAKDQMVIDVAWAEIRKLYDEKFNYTGASKRLQGTKQSEGAESERRSAEMYAQHLGKLPPLSTP